MAARVQLAADPLVDGLYPENRPARVTLDLTDGSEAQADVMAPKGDSARPLSRSEVRTKAARLMRAAWGDDGPFREVCHLLDETGPDLAQQLGRVLRQGFAPQPG